MKPLYDVNSAARLLSVSHWTVRAYIRDGKLRPVRLGRRVLLAENELERLVADTEYLCGAELTLADIHLAPMIGYFAMAEEGEAQLKRHRKLSHWWSTILARPAYRATMPRLPGYSDGS